MIAAHAQVQTQSRFKAFALRTFYGYRVHYRWCTPCLSVLGHIVYRTHWVLVPTGPGMI